MKNKKKKDFKLLNRNWFFRFWFWSMICSLVIYPLSFFNIINQDLHTAILVVSGIVGTVAFLVWSGKILIALVFGDKKIALREMLLSIFLFVIYFILLISFVFLFPTTSLKTKNSDEVVETQSRNISWVFDFDNEYPKESVYMHDLSLQDDPRRFYAYLFDDRLKHISDEKRSELRIEIEAEIVFRFFGNNAYKEELLDLIKKDSSYLQEQIYFQNTNFEKDALVITKILGDRQLIYYIFSYGGYDYLIQSEWGIKEDHRLLANNLLATMEPTTVNREYYQKLMDSIFTDYEINPSKSVQKEPEPSPQLHLVECYVDKNGKFDIFYTECLEMANTDNEGFRKKAIEICLDGKSPALSEQATREQRETICKDFFSQDPYPIANVIE